MRKFLRKLNNDSGFTLVELLVVIAILALLAGFAVPKLNGVLQNAKINKNKAEVALVQSAVDRWALDVEIGSVITPTPPGHGYPCTTAPTATTSQPIDFGFLASYLKKLPTDVGKFYIDNDYLVIYKP